ncbi:phage tail assembly chaperone [Pseudomonas japonica]|uniref:phage tail assembly chaperone n=1 Tax=Pseudomonas japonica TaxID=256466 RepID=UPI003A85B1E9
MKKVMMYSASTELFYDSRIHKEVPEDVMEVTQAEFQLLSTERNAGKRIVLDSGKLTLADREVIPLTQEEINASERVWRDTMLEDAQWLRDRHRDQVEIGKATTLTPEQFSELLVYLQTLRDWPQSESFPEVEHRPTAPSWMADQAP